MNEFEALYLYISLVRNASFLIIKKSGVREEVSDINKSLCKNIFLVSSRLCTSPLVCAPPQLTLFTSPTTPQRLGMRAVYNFERFRLGSLLTNSQESVNHKSKFTFKFTLRTIYKVNDTAT